MHLEIVCVFIEGIGGYSGARYYRWLQIGPIRTFSLVSVLSSVQSLHDCVLKSPDSQKPSKVKLGSLRPSVLRWQAQRNRYRIPDRSSGKPLLPLFTLLTVEAINRHGVRSIARALCWDCR